MGRRVKEKQNLFMVLESTKKQTNLTTMQRLPASQGPVGLLDYSYSEWTLDHMRQRQTRPTCLLCWHLFPENRDIGNMNRTWTDT